MSRTEGTEGFWTMIRRKIVFTGYAPVHFVCFRPLYRKLARFPQLEFHFSGGLAEDEAKSARSYNAEKLFRPFGVPRHRIIPLEELSRRDYDMVFCAHVTGFFPRSDRERVQIFHGLSFRNMAVRREVLIFDHLFITGPYMMRAFQENQLLRPNDPRCVPVGFPKVDRLVDGSLDRRVILKRLGLSGKRPIVLYAPTGLRGNSLETGRGEEVLKRLRAAGRVDLLVKLHDHMKDKSVDWPARLGRLTDAHTKLVRDPDIVPYLYAADLLLTDASSVSSEYCLLDRPMVFIDVPELLEAVQKKGNALDLETWGRRAGVTAGWPDEIVDAVGWSLDHPEHGSPVRKAMAADLFFNPGQAADIATRWVLDRLEIGPVKGRRVRTG
jgi:hypothetical protein